MSSQKAELNIVYIGRYNHGENLSGPEKTAKRLFTEHSKSNKAYFIQYFFDGRKSGPGKKLFGMQVEITGNALIYTAGLFRVYGLLRKIKPDIIHMITFERFAVITLLYKLFNDVKIVYNAHGIIAYENSELKNVSFWYRLKDKFSEKRFLSSADKIVFVSEQSLDIAEKYYPLDESKCVILANGVDSAFNNKSRKEFSSPLKAVLFYNNELHKSGYDFLTAYIKQFKHKIEIYVISPLNLNLEGISIISPMNTEKLAEFYNDKHIFLSLNKYDTFSIASAEAMAAGLIPIITNETGISRYIENGYNGYTLPYGSTEALDNILNKLISLSGGDKERISEKAKDIFESLSWENVYGTYLNIYKELK